ncbi:polymorphic toxin type 15 domain-containing protein [Xenorhabdus sp. SF857]|uniref:polymorphic toxin type 15 domain-containing protein n=1 Tax=Xenorhabdus bakwenae TaxID=3026967 RepID=UPI002557F80A|nr:polymorphic toxin type 15 domain-containing protein [Xenorhabdus sp. SF857]WFQ79629.1 polymorphic toxin type 15 domain-containing protein [Xenorhabdus sp. SF857]
MAKIKKTPPKPARDEALWKKRAHDDAPTGEGNTLGEITGQPPKSTEVPKEANPVIRPNTQGEEGFWGKVGDVVADVGTGILKNLGNTAIDIAEVVYKGHQADAAVEMRLEALAHKAAGNEAEADRLTNKADALMENADLDEYRFKPEGAAEELGDTLADLNPKGVFKQAVKGIAKGGSKAMSIITGKEKGVARKNSRAKRQETRAAERDKTTPSKDPDELKKELKEKQQNKGGKVKGVKKTKVPCFNPYDSKRYKRLKTDKERKAFLDEYSEQLRRQQDAINSMSPEEFKIARDSYKKNKRNSQAAGAQENFRVSLENDISDNVSRNLVRKGMSPQKADEIAKEKAKNALQGLAALHEPDMVAGGYGQYAPKKMGDSGINSAIGGSWKGGRIKSLDNAAKEAVDSGLGDAKMNIQLELCRGKGKNNAR